MQKLLSSLVDMSSNEQEVKPSTSGFPGSSRGDDDPLGFDRDLIPSSGSKNVTAIKLIATYTT